MEPIYFSEMFLASEGKSFEYKGRLVSIAGEMPVNDGDRLWVQIERIGSPILQGIHIMSRPKGVIECNGVRSKPGKPFGLWADTMPPGGIEVKMVKGCTTIRALGTSDRDRVTEWGVMNHGRAVVVETIENGFRCYCSDCEPDDDLDDLVFT
ncbi:MAG: hypothetical protein AABZ53_10915, partial [Planctomycetota bacterium]